MDKTNKWIIGAVILVILIGGFWYYNKGTGTPTDDSIGMLCYDSSDKLVDCKTGASTFSVVETPIGTEVAWNVIKIRWTFKATNTGTTAFNAKMTELTCTGTTPAACQASLPTVPTTEVALAAGGCYIWNWDVTQPTTCGYSATGDIGKIDVQNVLPTGNYAMHLKVVGTAGALTTEAIRDITFRNTQQGIAITAGISLG